MGLFRSLFPRWNFFDQVSSELTLEFKLTNGVEWQPLRFAAPRKAWSLLVNPYVTMLHAEASVLGDFVADLWQAARADGRVSSTDLDRYASYGLTKSIVKAHIEASGLSNQVKSQSIQFRIVSRDASTETVVFVSESLTGLT